MFVASSSGRKRLRLEDSILNGHLKHLDATHIFLSTLFSKTLLHSPEPWEGWSRSVISLIHKAGNTGDPKNFRPIALTSSVGKLFHQILSDRITRFVSKSGLIDASTQKAFIRGLSGCLDHNVIMQEVISHCKANKRTAHITFFDLEDAFGSVSHDLIPISLERMHIPENVRAYIVSLYKNLKGKLKTGVWVSDNF